MTNALDPKTPILKGVITEVLDDGNAGKINCGHGNIYTFVSDQLETGYLPVLKDVVEFNLIEDQPFAIRLFHRSQALHSSGSSGASVDLRVKCPHCGKPLLSKIICSLTLASTFTVNPGPRKLKVINKPLLIK